MIDSLLGEVELFTSRYNRMIGLARYTEAIKKHLQLSDINFTLVEPAYPALLQAAHQVLHPFGFDIREFFNTYPVSAHFTPNAVKHFTTQMMAILYSLHPKLQKVVITVHDIIPYLMRDDPDQNQYYRFYDRLIDDHAMQNIRRADRIIAISSYTAQMLSEHLGCPAEKIRVVPNGLDHTVFHPATPPPSFYARFNLSAKNRYLLYVGSENPRKNLPRLIRAFAEVKHREPSAKLIKIGSPENAAQYALLKEQICSAGLEDNIMWINNVSNEDLINFYAAADIFVFPSLYEGFGLPPLEAMACGAPVICSNTSSLPEVVGDAAVQVHPLDIDGWVNAVLRLLGDETLRSELKARGFDRAAQFTWARTVRETVTVYHEVNRI